MWVGKPTWKLVFHTQGSNLQMFKLPSASQIFFPAESSVIMEQEIVHHFAIFEFLTHRIREQVRVADVQHQVQVI